MLKIIGLHNCSKCIITKQILDKKNIQYEYVILTELPQDEQRKYAKMARDMKYNTMPLIIDNNQLITLQEVR